MQNPFSGLFKTNNNTVATTETAKWTGPTVPNLVGQEYDSAVKDAENSDSFAVYRDTSEDYSDDYDEGVIMEQFPKAGSKVEAAGEISISVKVSKGQLMRELPNIEDKSVNNVAKDLADLGFVVEAEYQYNSKVDKDIVIEYKDYKAGDKLEGGSTVTIIVSKGEVKDTQPSNQ